MNRNQLARAATRPGYAQRRGVRDAATALIALTMGLAFACDEVAWKYELEGARPGSFTEPSFANVPCQLLSLPGDVEVCMRADVFGVSLRIVYEVRNIGERTIHVTPAALRPTVRGSALELRPATDGGVLVPVELKSGETACAMLTYNSLSLDKEAPILIPLDDLVIGAAPTEAELTLVVR